MEIKEYPQVKTNVTTFVPAKHSYPIYLYYEEDGLKFEYVKIEKYKRITIKRDMLNTTVEIFNSQKAFNLEENYLDELSNAETFNNALNNFLLNLK